MNTMGMPQNPPELVRISIVARHRKYLYPLSLESVERMCRKGIFKTATKLGTGRNAHWFVHSTEVLSWKLNRNVRT